MRNALYQLTVFSIVVFLLLGVNALAEQSTFRLSFDMSDLSFEQIDGYDKIEIRDGVRFADPGEPNLPAVIVQVAIPAEIDAEHIEIVSINSEEIKGRYNIYPAQPPSYPGYFEPDFVSPNPQIYRLESEFPGKLAQVTHNGFLAGQHIAGILVYPLQYVPAQGKMILYTEIEFRIISKPSTQSAAPCRARSSKAEQVYSRIIDNIVINPEDVSFNANNYSLRSDPIEYLIISPDAFVDMYDSLASYRTNTSGINTMVLSVNTIYARSRLNVDKQTKIRNCIKDFYADSGTVYVLLGGDTDSTSGLIPHRLTYCTAGPFMDSVVPGSDTIPCDLYYSDLDGDWNADDDSVYGEGNDNVDLYSDVIVGRAPANDTNDVWTFIDKIITYESMDTSDYLRNVLLCVGEATFLDESNFIDENYLYTFYERHKLYNNLGNWVRDSIKAALNGMQNIVNHGGHGGTDCWLINLAESEYFVTSEVDSLNNGPYYYILFSISCLTASIDSNCIAEHFVNNPNGGSLIYMGASRVTTTDYGPVYNKIFYRNLFWERILNCGEAFAGAKDWFVPIMDDDYKHPLYSLNYLGDPCVKFQEYHPEDTAIVVHYSHEVSDSSVFDNDTVTMSIVVRNEGKNTATVREVILRMDTSSQGVASIADSIGTITDSILAPNDTTTISGFKVALDSLNYSSHDIVFNLKVTDNSSNWLSHFGHVFEHFGSFFHYSHDVSDTVVIGNESVSMTVVVKRIGHDTAIIREVILRVDSNDEDAASISDSIGIITDSILAPGDTTTISGFTVEIDAPFYDTRIIRFDLDVTDNYLSRISDFSHWFVRCGDANGDTNVDSLDAEYIEDYLWYSGPAPVPLSSADVNCDGYVNTSDIVYLTNYLDYGGNPPCDTDDDGDPDC